MLGREGELDTVWDEFRGGLRALAGVQEAEVFESSREWGRLELRGRAPNLRLSFLPFPSFLTAQRTVEQQTAKIARRRALGVSA